MLSVCWLPHYCLPASIFLFLRITTKEHPTDTKQRMVTTPTHGQRWEHWGTGGRVMGAPSVIVFIWSWRILWPHPWNTLFCEKPQKISLNLTRDVRFIFVKKKKKYYWICKMKYEQLMSLRATVWVIFGGKWTREVVETFLQTDTKSGTRRSGDETQGNVSLTAKIGGNLICVHASICFLFYMKNEMNSCMVSRMKCIYIHVGMYACMNTVDSKWWC